MPSIFARARRIRRITRLSDTSSCSQNLRTVHCLALSCRLTSLSLLRFWWIFFRQKSRRVTGIDRQAQPCQKQPSTKIATFCNLNTKSGLPGRCWWRRQPAILSLRSNPTNLSSVLELPVLRIAAMTAERFGWSNTSAIFADVVYPKKSQNQGANAIMRSTFTCVRFFSLLSSAPAQSAFESRRCTPLALWCSIPVRTWLRLARSSSTFR